MNALPGNLYSGMSQRIVDYAYTYFNPRPDRARFFASNNLAVPAEPFRTLGGFDPRFVPAAAEDRDLCDRWLQRGLRLAYVPEAVVYHAHHLTLAGFCRQHFGYGRGAHRFYRARAERGGPGLRPDPRFHLAAPRALVAGAPPHDALPLLGLTLLWQLANAAGYVREALGTRAPLQPLPPLRGQVEHEGEGAPSGEESVL
jgi:GT2 family glycosyltransferase